MTTSISITVQLSLLTISALFAACDTTETLRFRDQSSWYRFESPPYVVEVQGARLIDGGATVSSSFVCAAESFQSTADMAVLRVAANMPTPSVVVETDTAARCEQIDPIGIELGGLPFGSVDIYRRCDEKALQRFVTQCSLRKDGQPNVVAQCGNDMTACELVVAGKFELVAWSEYVDSAVCRAASAQREAYASRSEACDVCDTFSAMPITAALQGEAPDQSSCCRQDAALPTLSFCLKPCACRRTTFTLRPKVGSLIERASNLSLAVLSNVEGNRTVLQRFAESAREQKVDLVLSLGNLSTGGQPELRKLASFVRAELQAFDGEGCAEQDDALCCEPGQRQHPDFCSAMLASPSFSNGLGPDETDLESFYTFFEYFGPSTYTAFIGKLQLVMLDSADGTLGAAQLRWLEQHLEMGESKARSCSMGEELPEGMSDWPLLWECGKTDCNICLGMAARCVPPPAARSDRNQGPLNCLCVPASAKLCPGNLACIGSDDGSASCRCSRDEDCGQGARCTDDGRCNEPLRLFFTHTPPFDLFGARNAAFLSRREAAVLVATLLRGGVDLMFAGSIKTFAELRIAGIPLFVSGGGGADMEIFDETGHHYLLVNIPNAFSEPDLSRISIRPISLQ